MKAKLITVAALFAMIAGVAGAQGFSTGISVDYFNLTGSYTNWRGEKITQHWHGPSLTLHLDKDFSDRWSLTSSMAVLYILFPSEVESCRFQPEFFAGAQYSRSLGERTHFDLAAGPSVFLDCTEDECQACGGASGRIRIRRDLGRKLGLFISTQYKYYFIFPSSAGDTFRMRNENISLGCQYHF